MASTYPSIHVETLRITVGCLWSTYPSFRNKKLAHVRAVGTSTRADACACAFTGDPQPRRFELTLL